MFAGAIQERFHQAGLNQYCGPGLEEGELPRSSENHVYGFHLNCSWLFTEICDQLMNLLPGSWAGLASQLFF